MATKSAPPPVPSTPQDHKYDEFRGVYGFFRRHQKKLLYSAGLFTLLTFSITGPMTSVVRKVFGNELPMSSIVVGGKRIQLHPDDYRFGQIIARNLYTALPPVMPFLSGGEGNQSDLPDALAILRRAAIGSGIEVSMVEVDLAIKTLVEFAKAESAKKWARDKSFASLAEYREVVAEAMRIGTYVRLQTLALDTTDASALLQVLSDREKITLRTATFDEKVAEEQLKAAGALTDDDLHKWLDAKNDMEKNRIQVYDLPRAELRFGALLLAEGQFDPAEWQADVLKDFTVGDDQLNSYYTQEKDARWKLPDGKYTPFEDAAVKAELTRLVQAEQVMNNLLGKLRQKQTDLLKPQSDEVARTQAEAAAAEGILNDLGQQFGTKEQQLTAKAQELAQKPDDADLKAAHAALQAERTRLQEDLFQQKPVAAAKQLAVTVAEQAQKDARATFDFPAAFTEVTKDKKGFVQKAIAGLKNGDEWKDLDQNDLGLGQWALAAQATRLPNKGDLGFGPGRTTKAVLLYQATDVEPRPLKAWDKLKPLLEGAYWTEQAKTKGEAQKKVMEDALLRLAKTKMTEKLAEIEGKRTTRIDDKLTEWERQNQDGIAEAEKQLARPLGHQAKAAWQGKLDGLKAQLAGKEAQRKTFEAEVGKAIDLEIADEAKKLHGQVLDEAAAEAGFTVTTVGPYVRDLKDRPRFDKAYDPTVVFLWRSHSELKAEESTGLLVDPTNRRMHVAVCTKVEPVVAADITRREFEAMRTGSGGHSFADTQAARSYGQAFTLKALEIRYELQRPAQAAQ